MVKSIIVPDNNFQEEVVQALFLSPGASSEVKDPAGAGQCWNSCIQVTGPGVTPGPDR